MTEKFTFGEHERCIEMLHHCMTTMKEAGAKVTVETEHLTKRRYVLHTVCAEMPKKLHPIVFTRATEKNMKPKNIVWFMPQVVDEKKAIVEIVQAEVATLYALELVKENRAAEC